MMDEENAIRLFLENGFQLSKKVLPLVVYNPELIIAELKKMVPRPLFVTEEHIKNIEVTKLKPKIIKEYKKIKTTLKINDYISCFLSYYEKIKPILLQRMKKEKVLSINKITAQTPIFSIIGIVREKNDKNIILEDPSGEITIFFDDSLKQKFEEICLDDIIGVECKKTKEKVYAKNIYFPDILSSREINKTKIETKIAVLPDLSSLTNEDLKKLIMLLSEEKNLSAVLIFSDDPPQTLLNFETISISPNSPPKVIQIGDVKILTLCKDFFDEDKIMKDPIDFLISILKRRNILPSFDSLLSIQTECLILDEVPDILVSNFNKSFFKNYKGTTIISNFNPSIFYLVNLKTREIEEKRI